MIPVYFVLTRGLVLLDLAGPAEAFRVAERLCPGTFALHFCGPEAELECGLAGLHLARIKPLPARLPANALVIVSGVVGTPTRLDDAQARAIIDWLAARQPADGFTLMTVCAGALFAAAAGLTRGRECTTITAAWRSWRRWIPARGSSTTASSSRTARWSAGITAGIDLALHMVSRHCGPRIACEVAREMLVYQRRAGADSALSPWLEHRSHLHPGVHKVQDAVVRNPAAPWSAQSLAQEAHTSARHDPAVPPARGLHADGLSLSDTRRAGARPAARNPAGPGARGGEAGFGSAQHMRRVWRRFEPRTPGMARQQLAA